MADGQDFPETISASDVAGLLDMQVEKVIAGLDPGDLDGLSFRWLDDDEATEVSVRAAQELDDPMLNSAGPEAKIRWQRGWGEILECVRAEGVSEKSLAPQYFKLEVLRLGGRYIQAAGLEFEPRLYKAMRRILFIQYLSTAKHIIEFGCGTGANLLQLSQMFPAASLTGCDWAEPSQELVALSQNPRTRT
ncbi:MAG: class I SAM-dependent methyltransferase [Rhodospirillales bacterium]|nr:class I SAM-dependent methyltransferase [Rhodospirillales bacterium]